MRARLRRGAIPALALGAVAVAGALAWASTPFPAEPDPLAAVRANPAVGYRETADAVVLDPVESDGRGLVFLAGAHVEPAAYAATFAGIAERGVTVVIVRPILNFAIAEYRPLATFESLAPGVDRWAVGGHSLGGVRACTYVEDAAVEDAAARDAAADDTAADAVAGRPGSPTALVLFGSFCASDLSDLDLPTLSVGGEADGLSTPADIAAAADRLPEGAELVELPGASHAQFGAYGDQPGDGTPTATDAEVRRELTRVLDGFLKPAG